MRELTEHHKGCIVSPESTLRRPVMKKLIFALIMVCVMLDGYCGANADALTEEGLLDALSSSVQSVLPAVVGEVKHRSENFDNALIAFTIPGYFKREVSLDDQTIDAILYALADDGVHVRWIALIQIFSTDDEDGLEPRTAAYAILDENDLLDPVSISDAHVYAYTRRLGFDPRYHMPADLSNANAKLLLLSEESFNEVTFSQ